MVDFTLVNVGSSNSDVLESRLVRRAKCKEFGSQGSWVTARLWVQYQKGSLCNT